MGPQLFVDTPYWIAHFQARDAYHECAKRWSKFVQNRPLKLITTQAVLWEFMNESSRAITRQRAAQVYRGCYHDHRLQVVNFDLLRANQAVLMYESRSDKEWSLTDCLSFVVMKEHGIQEALTTDRHFTQAGFRALLRENPP